MSATRNNERYTMGKTWEDIIEGLPHRKSIEFVLKNGGCPSYWLYDGETPEMAWLTEYCLYSEVDVTGLWISEQGLIELEESIREIGRRLAALPLEDQRRIEIEFYGV
jgi:hypothetical protein